MGISVFKHSHGDKYQAVVYLNNKRHYVGMFDDESVARMTAGYVEQQLNMRSTQFEKIDDTMKMKIAKFIRSISDEEKPRRSMVSERELRGIYRAKDGRWEVFVSVKGKWTRLGRFYDRALAISIRQRWDIDDITVEQARLHQTVEQKKLASKIREKELPSWLK